MLGLRLTPCYYGVTVGTARVNASAMTEMRGVHWELRYNTPGLGVRAAGPQGLEEVEGSLSRAFSTT